MDAFDKLAMERSSRGTAITHRHPAALKSSQDHGWVAFRDTKVETSTIIDEALSVSATFPSTDDGFTTAFESPRKTKPVASKIDAYFSPFSTPQAKDGSSRAFLTADLDVFSSPLGGMGDAFSPFTTPSTSKPALSSGKLLQTPQASGNNKRLPPMIPQPPKSAMTAREAWKLKDQAKRKGGRTSSDSITLQNRGLPLVPSPGMVKSSSHGNLNSSGHRRRAMGERRLQQREACREIANNSTMLQLRALYQREDSNSTISTKESAFRCYNRDSERSMMSENSERSLGHSSSRLGMAKEGSERNMKREDSGRLSMEVDATGWETRDNNKPPLNPRRKSDINPISTQLLDRNPVVPIRQDSGKLEDVEEADNHGKKLKGPKLTKDDSSTDPQKVISKDSGHGSKRTSQRSSNTPKSANTDRKSELRKSLQKHEADALPSGFSVLAEVLTCPAPTKARGRKSRNSRELDGGSGDVKDENRCPKKDSNEECPFSIIDTPNSQKARLEAWQLREQFKNQRAPSAPSKTPCRQVQRLSLESPMACPRRMIISPMHRKEGTTYLPGKQKAERASARSERRSSVLGSMSSFLDEEPEATKSSLAADGKVEIKDGKARLVFELGGFQTDSSFLLTPNLFHMDQ